MDGRYNGGGSLGWSASSCVLLRAFIVTLVIGGSALLKS